jgi:putative aldouronate transport system permease protein
MDGASRFQQIFYITIPSILPTIMVMLILNIGNLMSLGYEKVLLMQTPTNMAASDIIDTYVYRLSLGASTPQYSLGTAVGLFNGTIGLVLVTGANRIARRLTGSGIY